jgi:hypothetical protein
VRKVGFKARSGRHRRKPEPHGDHRKRPEYSRQGRLLKQRVALMLAPKVSDFEIDRPRLGELDPLASGIHVSPVNRARDADTPGRTTHGGKTP